MAYISSLSEAKTKDSRSGLRIILSFVVLYAAIWIVRLLMGVGPNLLMKWLDASPYFRAYVGSTLNYGVGIASYIVFPAFALQKILHIDPRAIFFPLRKGWWHDLLFGFLWITAVLSLFFLLEVKAGWLVLEGWNWQVLTFDAFLRTAWVGLLVNVGVAIGEETIFRGYLLIGLRTVWGKWQALLVMTIVFGLFHLPAYAENGMQSATLTLAILLASLFGLLFGLVYLHTGSLWLPVSLHFTWNFVENDVLNLTADPTNINLIGALTRLQSPLSATQITLGNVVVLEMLMYGIIALGVWLWLKHRRVEYPILSK
jgi:membrane protease YdiL (CAAX protease family)